MKNIRYVPGLSHADLAILSGVELTAVRKFLKQSNYDQKYDKALLRYRRVMDYIRSHTHNGVEPSIEEMSSDLTKQYGKGYGENTLRNTVKKRPTPSPIKVSVSNLVESPYLYASVSEDDFVILRTIQHLYLDNYVSSEENGESKPDPRFDWDLTFGKGDFYRIGIDYPKVCFDKFPQTSSAPDAPVVHSLNDKLIEDKATDGTIGSIIIDLPQSIGKDGFKDFKDLVVSYFKLIEIAYRKLKAGTEYTDGGILVVKVGDIFHRGKRIWMRKIVTDLATGNCSALSREFYKELANSGYHADFDMQLIDKYVHIYPFDKIENNKRFGETKAHDCYFVFRKRPIEYDVVYLTENKLEMNFISRFYRQQSNPKFPEFSVWGCTTSGIGNGKRYVVPKLTGENSIGVDEDVSKKVLNKVACQLGFTHIPGSHNGISLLKYLYEHFYRQKTNNVFGEESIRKIRMQACEILSNAGVHCLRLPGTDDRRIYFDISLFKYIY